MIGPAVLLAILSDTHLPRGRRQIPEQALELARSADLILHAGDLMTLPVLEELRALGPPVVAIHGNADDEAVRAALPATATVDADGATIAMTHNGGPAAGRLARLHRRFPAADAVVFGHSHIPLHELGTDGFQIFNPGSATDRRRQPRHTMGICHAEAGALRFEVVALD
jgi:putative phosphoesterase